MILYDHLGVNGECNLTIGNVDTTFLAKKYGTPLYVLDENVIRRQCRTYLQAAKEYFGADALPLYASKALCFTEMYRIAADEVWE